MGSSLIKNSFYLPEAKKINFYKGSNALLA